MDGQESQPLGTDEDFEFEAERVREEREAILRKRARKAEKQQAFSQQPRVRSFADLVKKGMEARSNSTASDGDVVEITEARGEEVELDDGQGVADGMQDEVDDGQGAVTGGDTGVSSQHNDVAANSGDDTASEGEDKALDPIEAKPGRNVTFVADDGSVKVRVGEYVLLFSSRTLPIESVAHVKAAWTPETNVLS